MTLEEYKRRVIVRKFVSNDEFSTIISELDKLGGDWEHYSTYLRQYVDEAIQFEKAPEEERT